MYGNEATRSYDFEAQIEATLEGNELNIARNIHDCTVDGNRIYFRDSNMETGAGAGAQAYLQDKCDPAQPWSACTWANNAVPEPYERAITVELGAAAGQSTYIKLRKPVVTPYRAGFATLASDGALATTPNVQIIGVPSLSSNGTVKLPILQPVTAKFASLAPIAPFTRPNRNSDGNVIDDIDTTYMTDYKLRLLKIANSKANLHIINISFYRGGITEDVDFDIDLVSQATNAEPISGGAVATTGTKVQLIELCIVCHGKTT